MKRASRPVVCVLSSGGIDSSACIHFYLQGGYKVSPLFANYGQPAAQAELRSVKAISTFYGLSLRTVMLTGVKIPRAGEIFGRNTFLLSVALMGCRSGINLISLGIHSGTRYYDCSQAFAATCESLLSGYTDGRVRLGIPFGSWDKKQVWSYCCQHTVPTDLTWSCEASNRHPCGKCLSCRDKEALVAGS